MTEGHGDDLYRYNGHIRSNFSSNVYRGDTDYTPLREHLQNSFADIHAYPEPQPLSAEADLAGRHGLQPAEVCLTAGATEAIYLTAQATYGQQSAIIQPTFAEYADACRMFRHKVTALYGLPEQLPPGTDLLWLCNPNNPTGHTLPYEKVCECIRRHPDVLFVIDQSYAHFTRQRTFTAAEAVAYPNILLLHSMTKRFAVPGLRIGYATGCEALIRRLRAVRRPWSVSTPAIVAARFLCREEERFQLPLDMLLAERRRMAEALTATRAIEVWPSDTHILLAQLRYGTAAALKDYLAYTHGLLIRDASNFAGLDARYFRIAVQTPAENDRLSDAIGQWLGI